jgi:Arc/MetJ family transcription regulator
MFVVFLDHMRTTIDINDQLLAEAMAVSGLRTK